MMRKLLLFTLAFWSAYMANAQEKCGTTAVYNDYKGRYPQIEQFEKQLSDAYHAALRQNQLLQLSKTTADSFVYDIPVVVHVVHNYGSDYLPDDSIYNMIREMNDIYSLNYDTSGAIQPFKKYIGKASIRFHLATKDKFGNPTKGITRHYSYLTNGGDDAAKFDQWPPQSYFNIWLEDHIGLGNGVLAYSTFPSSAAAYPYTDGVIAGYKYVNPNNANSLTVQHETGHYFNLLHPWNNNGLGAGVCGSPYCGDDDVDDTPPTSGHCSVCNLYDTTCATGNLKAYPSMMPGLDSLIDYPDTTNVQNIMDYSTCPMMFTRQQVQRMHAALNNTIGNRNNLWTPANLALTGALNTVDVAPVAAFSVNNRFICQNSMTIFTNRSWNDTITNVAWTFPAYAATQASASKQTLINSFSQPGWVTVSIAATGNNTGTTTLTDSQAVFVADNNATSAVSYFQEFNPGGDMAKWPLFNYYNNNFKWQVNNLVGYYDNSSIQYVGYDSRVFPDNVTGSPKGDMDDFFSPVFDLTGLQGGQGPVSLNFMYSGMARSNIANDMNDELDIDFNTNCTNTWTSLATLTHADLDNQGSSSSAYQPAGQAQWSLKSIQVPATAITNHTILRFRYKPGVNAKAYTTGNAGYSTGNNFYMDRINFSNTPLGLNTLLPNGQGVVVAPNPTRSNAYVIVAGAGNSPIQVTVSDIAGRTVYTTQEAPTGNISRVEIPQAAITAKGMYLVHVSYGQQNYTEKFVVY